MRSTIEARVVDLPEPVGPVTRTRPRGMVVTSARSGGSPSVVRGGMTSGMARHDRPDHSPLLQDVHAEPAEAGDGVRGVELEVGLEALPLLLGEDGEDHPTDVRPVEHREIVERLDVAVDPNRRREAGREVEVRRPHREHGLEHGVDVAVGRRAGRDQDIGRLVAGERRREQSGGRRQLGSVGDGHVGARSCPLATR